jgi:hypothetical protein
MGGLKPVGNRKKRPAIGHFRNIITQSGPLRRVIGGTPKREETLRLACRPGAPHVLRRTVFLGRYQTDCMPNLKDLTVDDQSLINKDQSGCSHIRRYDVDVDTG